MEKIIKRRFSPGWTDETTRATCDFNHSTALKSTRLSRLSRHAEHAIGVRVHVHSRPHGTRRNRCRHRIRREHDDDAHGGGGDAAKASRRGERQGDGGARVDARVRRVRKLGRDDALQSPIVVVTMGDD